MRFAHFRFSRLIEYCYISLKSGCQSQPMRCINEAIFGRINEVAANVVVQALAGRLAESERATITSAIKAANSQAKSSAKGRL